MYVCNCNGITEREIVAAATLGCATLEDLRRDLGVATCCGKCEPVARALIGRVGGHCGSGPAAQSWAGD